uniref:uncharacterized protein LOC122599740 n=1 Tax=Erigeron canadensis TaxID=72917 RepID=UPI001CB8D6FA|nr:uncharacterized protein LOC122599740 [Erigeron canadensis]
MAFMKDYDHLKIDIKDIALATNNFDPTNVIGVGGFGKVYKGELSHSDGRIAVAFKKLDRRMGQGNIEFWKEIMMLSNYKHENLISLMHFCIEGHEMILVYEYATRGSLDHHLSNASLTWAQRLKICVGAARGLQYLHNPTKTHQRVIHRDIKSANILLDEKWTAKIADFGLSKAGPANQPQTYLITNAVGTPGYCDPLYWELGFLSKESDVYSFGVVLFEVLCGRLCFEYSNGALKEILVHKWRSRYVENCLDEIIFLGLKEQMDPGSLNSFSAIAYRCVKKSREERPMMTEIVKELEFALEQQEILEILGEKVDFTELRRVVNLALPLLSYVSQSQILKLLLEGFLIDDGNTWISINMNGQFIKVVAAQKCFFGDKLVSSKDIKKIAGSRRCGFSYYLSNVYSNPFRVEVDTQFLSPNVTYIIYIVFEHNGDYASPCYVPFEYKLDVDTNYSTSCIALVTGHRWVMTKLYQFTSYVGQQNFSIEFSPRDHITFSDEFVFEGIEFRPLEYETYQKHTDKEKVDIDLESNWETDFTDLIKLLKDNNEAQWTTKEELYFLFRKGFLVDDEKWFSISKNMKQRFMIPASSFLDREEWTCNSIPESESRFKVVTKSLISYSFSIHLKSPAQMSLPQTAYSCHLIYKLSDSYSTLEGPMVIGITDDFRTHVVPWSLCLNTRCHPPIIGGTMDDGKIEPCKTLDACKSKGHSKQRKDGWMEIQFNEALMYGNFRFSVEEEKYKSMNFFGIVIQGIEFRPL